MLRVPQKEIRARVIKEYMRAAGYELAVCFTCGNAARALRLAGVKVLEVSPLGPLSANRWWTPAEIRAAWPHAFDATSGHLPAHLMVAIAGELRRALGALPPGPHYVPTGSGETIACLRWAYPWLEFVPVQDGTPATARSGAAALAPLIALTPELLPEL